MTTIELIEEVSQILRKTHKRYDNRGDCIANASKYLRDFREKFPDIAKDIAFTIECDATNLSEKTGLPERRLFQVSRVLFGIWCEL